MRALIVGAGAQGRMVEDILRCTSEYDSLAFIDDDPNAWGRQIDGVSVTGGTDEALYAGPAGCRVIVAVGRNASRCRLALRFREAGFELLNAIHPSAVVLPGAVVGTGNMIGALCVVNTGARIGDNVILNAGSVVEHDSVIEDGVLIGCGTTLGGRVHVGAAALIGMGSVVLNRVSIGA